MPPQMLKIRVKDLLQAGAQELEAKAGSHAQRESLRLDFALIEDFVMQYRDGSSWRDIPGTITRGNGEVFWQREFAPITCDRVRLMAQKTKGHISRIWEIELYEPAQK